jgi:hypothetical protein
MASTPVESSANELWLFTYEYVEQMGRHFGEGAGEDLRYMILSAGRELDAIVNDEERRSRVVDAKHALAELLDKAVEIAQTLDGYPDDLLGERSYFPARRWFCPRWPFCR